MLRLSCRSDQAVKGVGLGLVLYKLKAQMRPIGLPVVFACSLTTVRQAGGRLALAARRVAAAPLLLLLLHLGLFPAAAAAACIR